MNLKNIAVFCGASNKVSSFFIEEAHKIGVLLAKLNITLVYGGSKQGMMGAAADAALKNQGTVLGVFPKNILDHLEIPHQNLTQLIIASDMQERKLVMFNNSDAFIIMPGGFGTMDELFEILTLKYLHHHNKAIIIYNYKNFYDDFESMAKKFVALGFANENILKMYVMLNTIEEVELYINEINNNNDNLLLIKAAR